MTMSGLTEKLSRLAPYGLAAVRVIAALLFMQHGLQKVFGFPPGDHPPGQFVLFSFMGVGGLIEMIGGFLVAIGLFTRPAAFLMSGEMAFAYFVFHVPDHANVAWGWIPVVNDGDLCVLFCFTFFHIFLNGAGLLSVDRLLARRSA